MSAYRPIIDLEQALGVTEGHDHTIAFIDRLIAQIEQESHRAPRGTRIAGRGLTKSTPVDAGPCRGHSRHATGGSVASTHSSRSTIVRGTPVNMTDSAGQHYD